MVDTADSRQQRIKPENSFIVSFPDEANFDGLHEDKGLHTGGRTIIGREPTSRQGGWQTLRMLRDPQATKQGAKGARPLPKMSEYTSMVDFIGTTSYGYDAAGRLTSSTNPYGFAVSYHYDAAGNLDQLTYPGNKTVYYTYDELNRLHTATIGWITPNPVATYTHDAAGRLDYVTNFNGTITDYGYDNANRLTSLENRKSDSTILATYAFTLDGNGNRTNTIQTELYTNLPSMGATSYTYNLQKNRLLTAGGNSFTYDDEGQLGTGYGSTYTFDYEHRLTAFGSTTFSYDGTGNRLQAVRSGTTTRYLYDASGNLLAEADGSNNITKYYIHGAGLLAMVTPASQVYCYHFNATGHTMAVTDSAQAVANKYSYDAYGTVTNQQEAVTQPFKYVGQLGVMTEPNGFYYMRARYYDPQVGRFISEDPIGFDGGDENLYAYVGGNPVMGVDPEGTAGFHQHFADGFIYGVSRAASAGIATGIIYGIGAMLPDFGRRANNPVIHATTTMQTGTNTAQTAISRSSNFVSQQRQLGTFSGTVNAIHTARDIGTHAGTYFPENPSRSEFWSHVRNYDESFSLTPPKGF